MVQVGKTPHLASSTGRVKMVESETAGSFRCCCPLYLFSVHCAVPIIFDWGLLYIIVRFLPEGCRFWEGFKAMVSRF